MAGTMIVQTIFYHDGHWERGEVEVHLLSGIPNLHVVGLPDAQIRECGIKLRSALKSCGYKWPTGHQIIVNLRPNHFRKSSAGVELAIALGVLAETRQLAPALMKVATDFMVYGEIALDGRVIAPHDVQLALRATDGLILTGSVDERLREGEWFEIQSLEDEAAARKARFFDWDAFFERPELPQISFHPEAAHLLTLTAHMGLHVLLAGPQGSGKTTWAQALYALSSPPELNLFLEREEWVGVDENVRWRPLERPHHSLTPLAMVGGSYPIQPGIVTRAHGGILLMDEFLEFNSQVLENLREPLEGGRVEVARKGSRERLPARFQLIATTNLCPCGKLFPESNERCHRPIFICAATSRRLSGPLLDRFDLLSFTHNWHQKSESVVPLSAIAEKLRQLHAFRAERAPGLGELPHWVADLGYSHRRRNSLLRVARGLADLDFAKEAGSVHFTQARQLVVDPISELGRLFA